MNLKVGDQAEGVVIKIVEYGAFVRLADGQRGLVHISQVANDFVKDINSRLKVGQKLTARILKVGANGRIDLSLKLADEHAQAIPAQKNSASTTPPAKFSDFEEKLDKFLASVPQPLQESS